MTTTAIYNVRASNAIPLLCGSTTSQGNIIYTFGTECQEVILCGYTSKVLKSEDMCLLGGEYFSANYKALPGKVNGKLVFTSNLAKKPSITNEYGKCFVK